MRARIVFFLVIAPMTTVCLLTVLCCTGYVYIDRTRVRWYNGVRHMLWPCTCIHIARVFPLPAAGACRAPPHPRAFFNFVAPLWSPPGCDLHNQFLQGLCTCCQLRVYYGNWSLPAALRGQHLELVCMVNVRYMGKRSY